MQGIGFNVPETDQHQWIPLIIVRNVERPGCIRNKIRALFEPASYYKSFRFYGWMHGNSSQEDAVNFEDWRAIVFLAQFDVGKSESGSFDNVERIWARKIDHFSTKKGAA